MSLTTSNIRCLSSKSIHRDIFKIKSIILIFILMSSTCLTGRITFCKGTNHLRTRFVQNAGLSQTCRTDKTSFLSKKSKTSTTFLKNAALTWFHFQSTMQLALVTVSGSGWRKHCQVFPAGQLNHYRQPHWACSTDDVTVATRLSWPISRGSPPS